MVLEVLGDGTIGAGEATAMVMDGAVITTLGITTHGRIMAMDMDMDMVGAGEVVITTLGTLIIHITEIEVMPITGEDVAIITIIRQG